MKKLLMFVVATILCLAGILAFWAGPHAALSLFLVSMRALPHALAWPPAWVPFAVGVIMALWLRSWKPVVIGLLLVPVVAVAAVIAIYARAGGLL